MQSKDYVPGVSGFKIDLTTGQVEINQDNVRIKATASMITYAVPEQGNDQAADSIREALNDQQGVIVEPLVVECGQLFINGSQIDDAAIASKIATDVSVRLSTTKNGQSYVAGFGVGPADEGKCAARATSALTARVTGERSEPASDFEKALAEGAVGKILDMLAGTISETALGQELTAQIDKIEKADLASVQALDSRVASMETILASRFAMIDQFQTKIETEEQIRNAIVRELRPGGLLHRFNR